MSLPTIEEWDKALMEFVTCIGKALFPGAGIKPEVIKQKEKITLTGSEAAPFNSLKAFEWLFRLGNISLIFRAVVSEGSWPDPKRCQTTLTFPAQHGMSIITFHSKEGLILFIKKLIDVLVQERFPQAR